MYTFCTISTSSHLFKAYALADSISSFNGHLHILLIDGDKNADHPGNVVIHTREELADETSRHIILKYKNNKDKLRWALKPCFVKHLLTSESKVIYADNDIFFYGDYRFLFRELDESDIILTPHFYPADPKAGQNWLEANFRVGLYNAGFLGVNKSSIDMLDWWAECCLYNVKKVYRRGLFDDQKYLDLVPVLFDRVKILKHAGCNLAGWNYKNYRVKRTSDSAVMLNDKQPLIFIHFAELSWVMFSQEDSFFYKEFLIYLQHLKQYKPNYFFRRRLLSNFNVMSYVHYLCWKAMRLLEKNARFERQV